VRKEEGFEGKEGEEGRRRELEKILISKF